MKEAAAKKEDPNKRKKDEESDEEAKRSKVDTAESRHKFPVMISKTNTKRSYWDISLRCMLIILGYIISACPQCKFPGCACQPSTKDAKEPKEPKDPPQSKASTTPRRAEKKTVDLTGAPEVPKV